MNGSDSRTGLLFMAAGMFLYSLVDTQSKLLTADLHPLQVAWMRQLGLLAVVVYLFARRGREIFRTNRPGFHIARGVVAGISAAGFIIAVSFVPLADATIVAFVAPFMVTVMGALILGEHVGVRRWTAVTLGFVGALIVIRPGMGVTHPAILFAAFAAFMFAVRQILSRSLGSSEKTTTTLAYTALFSCLVLALPVPFVWKWPSGPEIWAIAAGAATLAAVGEFTVIRALETAQAVVVAPVQYSMLLWGTLWGYLVFGDLPDMWTWVGAAIIVATGVYTLRREAMVRR